MNNSRRHPELKHMPSGPYHYKNQRVCAEKQASERDRLASVHLDDVWRVHVATANDRWAAAGLLAMVNGIGYLTSAWILDADRGKGCQTMLLKHRIAQAAREGMSLVVPDTHVNSQSQRNMQRAGLSMAYQVVQWAKLET